MDSSKRKKYKDIIPVMNADDVVMITREELEQILGMPIQPFEGDEFPMVRMATDEEKADAFGIDFEMDFDEIEGVDTDPKETIH